MPANLTVVAISSSFVEISLEKDHNLLFKGL